VPWLDSAGFADIDEQAAALDGWNQHYVQLSPGPFSGQVRRLQLDGVGLFLEELHQAVYQTGRVRDGVVALGVLVAMEGDGRFCGQACSSDALHVYSGDGGFEFLGPQRHLMLGIEIELPVWVADLAEPGARALPRAGLVRQVAAARLRTQALSLFEAALHGQAPGPMARARLLDEVAQCPRGPPPGAAADGEGEARGTRGAGPALARRAHRWVAERLEEPPTVAEWCAALGVSRRTLQAGIQQAWGMGPLALLNALRLDAARRELKRGRSVTEAAVRYGFCHFGHFAADYRRLFGEPPSQTRRRRGAA
jgi:AraC family ethanolamine operon transcriptional activator